MFEREADRLGRAPPVIEGNEVLNRPAQHARPAVRGARHPVHRRHAAAGRAGRRDTDGVWAPAWYAAVERSTGFGGPVAQAKVDLPDPLRRIAEQALPHYRVLVAHRLD